MYRYCHQSLSPVINGFFVLFAILIFATELKERSFAVGAVLALFVFVAMWLAQHSAMLIPNRAFGSTNARSQFISTLTERLRTG
jgi:hypothetical protein